MPNKIEQLQTLIQDLQDYVNLLKQSSTIPLEIDQAFRERFTSTGLQSTGTGSATTQSVSVPSTPTTITVPAQPSGTLKVTVGNVSYELLYK